MKESLMDRFLSEVHGTIYTAKCSKNGIDTKFAIYINRIAMHMLAREQWELAGKRSDIDLLGDNPGCIRHCFGYPVYEVDGQDNIPWNIVEVLEIIR